MNVKRKTKKCECGKTIRGKAFTVLENIKNIRVIKYYHPQCFEEQVIGLKRISNE